MKQDKAPSEDPPSDASAPVAEREPETEEESTDGAARTEPPFPVVGVGASAGGVEAFTDLLKHLPADTGMAFVVVQHLAPNHQSLLTNILARATSVPVAEVTEGMRVEPNHVYVIPPNTDMTIAEGALRLTARPSTTIRPLPIDSFLSSLAVERGSKAIGVILSGTASDGTLGLKAVKANGGITFAQDGSAKYEGMPQSAIAAGYVDYVLPPEGIAREIARLSRHPYVAAPGAPAADTLFGEDDLAKVFVWLRARTGVDFRHYKPTTIMRRMRRRMVLLNIDAVKDYMLYLQRHPPELDALFNDILIHVTSFFREPESFQALKTEVFPRLMEDRPPDGPLRIWVPACSTGEEAYSVAICAAEFLQESNYPKALQLFASDISKPALDKARMGKYAESDLAGVSADRLRRYFVRTESGYRVAKSIRESCVFAEQNLIKDPPFSKLDLISCRNLLIYLSPSMQKKLVPLFHASLRPGGFLMLGRSEGIGDFADRFEVANKRLRTYRKKPAPPGARPAFDLTPSLEGSLPGIVAKKAAPVSDLQKELQQVLLAECTPAAVLVDQNLEIVQFHGKTGAYLSPAPGAASLRILKMAREGLALHLSAALREARNQDAPVISRGIPVEGREVTFEVRSLKLGPSRDPYFLVLFRDAPLAAPAKGAEESAEGKEVAELSRQLDQTRVQLQEMTEQGEARNEELQAANEEVESSNEELQSTNEELETAKEELQAMNEELTTLNEELRNRNHALSISNDDLTNTIDSIQLPMLILDADLRIRHFTAEAAQSLSLIPADVGRPVTDLRFILDLPDFEPAVRSVITTMQAGEREVKARDGRWYALRVRPYRTGENHTEGAVITLVDIDKFKTSVAAALDYAATILETVRDSFLVLDGDLRIEAASPSFFETFRTTRQKTEGRLLAELGEGEWNIRRLLDLLHRVLSHDEEVRDFVVEHEFPDLGWRSMVLNAKRTRAMPGRDLILLSIEDDTKRRLTARDLDRQAGLIELAYDAIILRDFHDAVLSWNRGAEAVYGWTKQEALGKVTHTFLQTVFPEPFPEVEHKLFVEGHWEGELLHTTKTGSQVRVASRQVVRLDPSGQPDSILEINRDITSQRASEAALRESEARLKSLIDGVKDYAIYALDAEGRVMSWNSGAEQTMGYRAEEILGKPCSAFYPPEDVAAGKPERDLAAAAAEGRYEDWGSWRQRKDGSRFWANTVITALRDEHENLRGFIRVTRDITERKSAEEAARELTGHILRAQDEERRRIARELHDSTAQTLSGLAVHLALIEARPPVARNAALRKAIQEAEEMAKRAGNEVRDLSHLLHPPDLDTIGLVAAIRWYAARFSERSGIEVEVDVPAELRRLPQDIEVALFRVVQESLSNVQRHSGSSVAKIGVRDDGREVIVEIADRGRGMPDGVVSDAVRPGLGIAGMQERVKQLGGRLEIASHDGKGTTATVRMPVPPDQGTETPDTSGS